MKTHKDLLVSVKYIFKLKTYKKFDKNRRKTHTHIIITPIIRENRRAEKAGWDLKTVRRMIMI